MSSRNNVSAFDEMMRDLHTAGEPKPWVVKARAERAELERTGLRISVMPHMDNTGIECRSVGVGTLVDDMVNHDCCHVCNLVGGQLSPPGEVES